MATKYAQTGPPFHFLGNMSETQKNAFSAWVTSQSAELPATQVFHQIRAQQLRKAGGMLEQFHAQLRLRSFWRRNVRQDERWAGMG